MALSKKCPKCGIDKPATAKYWYIVPGRKLNLSSSCKVCHNEYSKQRNKKNHAVRLARRNEAVEYTKLLSRRVEDLASRVSQLEATQCA